MKMSRIPAVFFKVLSEIQNKIVDGAGIGVDLVAPNGLKYFFPLHHFILVLNEQPEQHGLFFT
jgi:hypothetical protein